MPEQATRRVEEMREAAAHLHERLAELQHWAMQERGIASLQEDEDLGAVRRRQQDMLESIQGLASALDTWVSISQSTIEHYLPMLAELLRRAS